MGRQVLSRRKGAEGQNLAPAAPHRSARPSPTPRTGRWHSGTGAGWVGLALILLTLTCYWPAGRFGFIIVDDPDEVSQMVQQGVSVPGVRWAFTSVVNGNWQPLTTLSHMLDCQLWVQEPGKHHLTNLLLHTAGVLFLFLLLRAMTGTLWRSAFVAALFAWHPMHVESIAWIAERKDVLSGFFFFLTLWSYCGYTTAGWPSPPRQNQKHASGSRALTRSFYALALLSYALGLMSKPMLVTLPFVLLLLDFWPLRRFASTVPPASSAPAAHPVVSARRLLWEKVPFLVLSVLECAVTLKAQAHAGAVTSLASYTILARLENALTSYAFYLCRLFWPTDLAALYPYPDSIPFWQPAAAAVLLGTISLAVLRARHKHPSLTVGWLWFLGMLVPVIGLVQVGSQSRADRYTYLPYIGLGLMLAWGLPPLVGKWLSGSKAPKTPPLTHPPVSRGTATALALAAVLALASCWVGARAQLQYWRDSTTLFAHTVEVTSQNQAARNILGMALAKEGKLDAAAAQFQDALEVKASHSGFRPDCLKNLGKIHLQQHRFDAAIAEFSEALTLSPDFVEARLLLGLAYEAKGQMEQAVDALKFGAELAPGDMSAQGWLAEALVKSGKAEQALTHCQSLAASRPAEPAPRFILAGVYISLGRIEEAIGSIRQALQLAPRTPVYLAQLARLLATCPEARLRDGPEAVSLAERACALSQRQNSSFLDTLSAAYAEVGRFPDALRTAEEARLVALAHQDQKEAEASAQKLELYRAGKPYRETPKVD